MADPNALIPPPLTPARDLDATLARQGYAVLGGGGPDGVEGLLRSPVDTLAAWSRFWDDLPPDTYLRDGGKYRRRRHGSFIVGDGAARLQPQRPHWQPVDYNALHGGIERHFEPIAPALTDDPLWQRWLLVLAARAEALRARRAEAPPGRATDPGQPRRWYVEAHLFRIDTASGIGRPTPEGAHRDGVDLVAVTLVGRHGIKGGESRVFQADSAAGLRFTLAEPWTTVLLDDARVVHETTPIQPATPSADGHRDTLVVTLREGGFQGPAPT
jgi:hypothetical protein